MQIEATGTGHYVIEEGGMCWPAVFETLLAAQNGLAVGNDHVFRLQRLAENKSPSGLGIITEQDFARSYRA